MISVTQAQATIRQYALPLPAEAVSLSEAHGCILRESVICPEDMPPFDRSAMDGYAIRAGDSAEEFQVVEEIRAGQAIDRKVQAGEAIRIFTGARLPGPDLKVVMQEHVEASDGRIRLLQRVSQSHVRLRGEDARAGDMLIETGTTLDATAVALLASIGKTSILVSRRPRVFHLTTGDEIVPADQTPEAGQIRNSNAFLISSLCREHGVEIVDHFHAADDLSALLQVISEATPETCDVVLISGGSGHGDYDFSAELFRRLEAEIHFREVNVRPGKPLIFGTTKRGESAQIIFGLPGNALSHFVCFHLFVRQALEHLLARLVSTPMSAFLSEPMSETRNARETWWPAQVGLKEGRLECRALRWKSSGDITRLPSGNALIHVPASTSQLDAGTMVNVVFTRNLS